MISVYSDEQRIKPRQKFLCESRSEIALLPTTVEPDPNSEGYADLQFPYAIDAGSFALVVAEGDVSVWVLTSSSGWIEIM